MKAALAPLLWMELQNLHMPKVNLARDSFCYLTNLHPNVGNLLQNNVEKTEVQTA